MRSINSYPIESGVHIEVTELKEEMDILAVERPELKKGIEWAKISLDAGIHPEDFANAIIWFYSMTPSERHRYRSEWEQALIKKESIKLMG